LQYILKKYFLNPITEQQVLEAADLFQAHGVPFNKEGWLYIVKDLKGKLPLRIRAVPEGSVIPTNNVLMTVENTDPKCFWLTSYVETALMRLWYPTTVASLSWHAKQLILSYLTESSDDPDGQINFKLHDFGARGVSSQESAAIGGAAHLINFLGTDTVVAMLVAKEFYNAKSIAGYSIPAAEHSTITAWTQAFEVDAYKNMLAQFAKPGSLVAIVSDSYDLDHTVDNIWGKLLKNDVIKSGATVIIRPDSGNPAKVVLRTVQSLAQNYGTTWNKKGYKVLNNVKVIQGDGINIDSIEEILKTLTSYRFSIDNIAFGMGGGLLQQVNRDTQKFAYKCSSIQVEGEPTPRDVFKEPKTDPGKRSKAGRLDLIRSPSGTYKTISFQAPADSVLKVVYLNGDLLEDTSWEDIRTRCQQK